jgi:hypothetical protein
MAAGDRRTRWRARRSVGPGGQGRGLLVVHAIKLLLQSQPSPASVPAVAPTGRPQQSDSRTAAEMPFCHFSGFAREFLGLLRRRTDCPRSGCYQQRIT